MKTRKLTRRILGIGAAVTAAAIVLSGCGRSDDADTGNGGKELTEGAASGTIQLWAAGAEAEKIDQVFDEFYEKNPDVKIKMTQVPEEDFVTKMTAAIAAGTVPDLVYVFTEHQPALFATRGFAPVPEGVVDADDFLPAIWETGTVDGTQYGVPWFTYARVFQYRKDLVEAAGAQPPDDWDGLREFAAKLKQTGVEFPLAFYVVPFDEYTAAQYDTFARANGGGIIDDDNSKWTIDTPANVEALEFWGSLFHDGYVSPDKPTSVDSVALLTDGKLAGVLNGPWLRGWLADANGQEWVDEKMATLIPPAGPTGDRSASVGGGNWAVPADAKNGDAAWKFVQFMSQPETQLKWFEIMGNLPTVESAWDDPLIADNEALGQVRDSMEFGVPVPQVPTWNEVGKILAAQLEGVARGTSTAQEALKAAQAEADAIGVSR